ncbi:hypothetical protein LMG29542_06888 [Paraburkholderia humisilvae]|uniref:Uncharacterized protein n=1 Tax=Paraburkholderia humisilvae TaxID=627669 RepID=A0A6J5F2C2_9BURK|nr:hypothetical protein LMG29542_06888 [Paraburkholderia humisilvae]
MREMDQHRFMAPDDGWFAGTGDRSPLLLADPFPHKNGRSQAGWRQSRDVIVDATGDFLDRRSFCATLTTR